jgi:hypothetical protein
VVESPRAIPARSRFVSQRAALHFHSVGFRAAHDPMDDDRQGAVAVVASLLDVDPDVAANVLRRSGGSINGAVQLYFADTAERF